MLELFQMFRYIYSAHHREYCPGEFGDGHIYLEIISNLFYHLHGIQLQSGWSEGGIHFWVVSYNQQSACSKEWRWDNRIILDLQESQNVQSKRVHDGHIFLEIISKLIQGLQLQSGWSQRGTPKIYAFSHQSNILMTQFWI